MECAICGEGRTTQGMRNLSYAYNGERTVLAGVTGEFCPECGEMVLDADEAARTSARMLAFHREVSAAARDQHLP